MINPEDLERENDKWLEEPTEEFNKMVLNPRHKLGQPDKPSNGGTNDPVRIQGESFYFKYLCKVNELECKLLTKDEEIEALRDKLLHEVLKKHEAIIGNSSQALIEKNKQLPDVIDKQRKTIHDLRHQLHKVEERNSVQAHLLHHGADKWEESANLQSEVLGRFEDAVKKLDGKLKTERSTRVITEEKNKFLVEELARAQRAFAQEKAHEEELSQSLKSLQHQMAKSENHLQEKLAAAQKRVSDLENTFHASKEEQAVKMASLKMEEDIKNENLQRRIDEAEITILNQAKLVQSQALELEHTGPRSELCNKLQDAVKKLDGKLIQERSMHVITEEKNKFLVEELARAQIAFAQEKAHGDELSQSLKSLQYQMAKSENHLQEKLAAAQKRVSDLENSFHASKEELAVKMASFKMEEDIKNENLQRRIDEAEITMLNQAKLVQSQALELEHTGPRSELCNTLQDAVKKLVGKLKQERSTRVITEEKNKFLVEELARAQRAFAQEKAHGDELSQSLKSLQHQMAKSENHLQEKLAAAQKRVADLENSFHASKEEQAVKMASLKMEEDIKNENLQRRIDEAEITILNQAKLVQSQALELEHTGPPSELCNKLQKQDMRIEILQRRIDDAEIKISKQAKLIQSQALELKQTGSPSELQSKLKVRLNEVELQLKEERLLRIIAEGKVRQHALSHSEELKQKARCEELSQSLGSRQHQMRSSEKYLHEKLTVAQHRVVDFEVQLQSSNEQLSTRKMSLKLLSQKQNAEQLLKNQGLQLHDGNNSLDLVITEGRDREEALAQAMQVGQMSQQMRVNDERISVITLKNEGLSESLTNVVSKLSDMEHQFQEQRQQHEEERQQHEEERQQHEEERQRQQQNHVENCQQIAQVLQQMKVKDKQIDEVTLKKSGTFRDSDKPCVHLISIEYSSRSSENSSRSSEDSSRSSEDSPRSSEKSSRSSGHS